MEYIIIIGLLIFILAPIVHRRGSRGPVDRAAVRARVARNAASVVDSAFSAQDKGSAYARSAREQVMADARATYQQARAPKGVHSWLDDKGFSRLQLNLKGGVQLMLVRKGDRRAAFVNGASGSHALELEKLQAFLEWCAHEKRITKPQLQAIAEFSR